MKFLLVSLCFLGVIAAQPTVCTTQANAPLVRHEGLTERVGDIALHCTSTPGATLTVNLSVQLSATVTNRLSTGNSVTGPILTADSGLGPQAVTIQPILLTQNTLVWQGVPLTFSSTGAVVIRVANILVNASGIPVGQQIFALLGGGLSISPSELVVAVSDNSLYVGYSGKLICAQNGSPVPGSGSVGFASLIAAGTTFTSTRLTEAFAGAFSPKGVNADTGTRFLVQYTGFPQGAQLFVPNEVAGSDAVQPTAGGDLGLAESGGVYAPSTTGSLLLALVVGADSTGAGGTVQFTPGTVGSGTVTFDTITQLPIVGGNAYAVYEVVDSNPLTLETAQFPTFLGLQANLIQSTVQTSEGVTYAPVSQVTVATATDPIPRFLAIQPPSDCGLIGDCAASYFPQLTVNTPSLQFPIPGSSLNQVQYLPVLNSGAGVMQWTASVSYTNGSGWLVINPLSGTNNGTIQVGVNPASLAVGTYQATLTIDAGSAGRKLVPVTLTIAQTVAPGPVITAIENAASFAQVPVVAGSLATIVGTGLLGANVSVSFDGIPGTITYDSATQINLLVPSGVASLGATQVVVVVGSATSTPVTVNVAPFEPGIFPGAVVNQNGTVNTLANPAAAGSIVYFYATGLSGSGTITAKIGSTEITNLYYAGPAPGYAGVQQINVQIPTGLGSGTMELYACGTSGGTEVCSVGVPITLN